jgi:hypothetical protein
MITADNPMQRRMHASPRCGAKTRGGGSCNSPAMPNGRCRMHGGASTGAPKGVRNGMYRHGRYTAEAAENRRKLNAWIRTMREDAQDIL